jgi:nucleoid-associated protein YgaU
VTVVATPEQVSDAVLDDIRGTGAIIVERVVADTPEATKAKLDKMAVQGQRFLALPEEPPPDPGEPAPPEEPAEIYIVQPGDTLGKIAKQFYGDFTKWRLIFEANRDSISDPGLIRVGMELRIPKLE